MYFQSRSPFVQSVKVEYKYYESPKKEIASYVFKHLIQNLKLYNRIKV